jgi:hypothetical protein
MGRTLSDSVLESQARKDVLMARQRRTDANLSTIQERVNEETAFAKLNDEQRIRTMSESMFRYGEYVMAWVSDSCRLSFRKSSPCIHRTI